MKPTPERCALLKFVDVAERLKKRLLDTVARVFFVSNQPSADGQQAPAKGSYEMLVTGAVAGAQSGDQLLLIRHVKARF